MHTVPILKLQLLRNLAFWVLLILGLNVLSIGNGVLLDWQHSTGLEFFVNYSLGVVLQLPFLLALAAVHTFGGVVLRRVLDGRAKYVVALFNLCILFGLLLFYATGQLFYNAVGVFPSFGLFISAIYDTSQLLGIIIDDHALPLAIVTVLAFGLTVAMAYLMSFFSRFPRLEKPLARILVVWVVIYPVCLVPVMAESILESKQRNQIANHTYPTTHLSHWVFGRVMGESTGSDVEPLDPDTLAKTITMAEYKALNPAPEVTPNIFLILLESVPPRRLGFNGYYRTEITPRIDAFSEECVVFDSAFAASNHSNYSYTSIHGSQYPRRGHLLDLFVSIDYPKLMLFDILGAYGYETAFISAQNEDWQGMNRYIQHESDIDYFFHSKDMPDHYIGRSPKIDDSLARAEAERFIGARDSDKPLYLYLNFQRTHFPYTLPEEAPTPYEPNALEFDTTFIGYPKEHIEAVSNRFDNALHYVDAQLGAFFDFLKEQGLYDSSIIVVASDHGEAFYENGLPTHGTSLYNLQIQSFMLVRFPGAARREHRSDPVSLIDINPSLLEMIGLGNHPIFQGEPVFLNPRTNPYVYVTGQGIIAGDAVIKDEWKFIRRRGEDLRLINYKLDPDEQRDFTDEEPEIREDMEHALDRYMEHQVQYYKVLSSEVRNSRYPPRF